MLDRVSTVACSVWMWSGRELSAFADYSQWEAWQAEQPQAAAQADARQTPRAVPQSTSSKKKLSYLEAREYASIEERVAAAEHVLEAKRVAAGDPSIASDATRLMNAHVELDQAQHEVDELYARWAELEKKQA